MKRFLLVSLVLLLLASSITPALSATLSVVQVKKTNSNWCWAACCEMLIKYFKGTATQKVVVKSTYGDYRNDGANTVQCDRAIDKYQKQGVNGMVRAGGLSWTAVKYQINNSGPVLAFRLQRTTGAGHFIVVRGYNTSNNKVWYNEPDTGGNQWIAYNQFFDYGNDYWAATVFYK